MAGFTQEELGRRCGVKRSTVAHWESPRSSGEPGPAPFKRLVAALGVDREALLEPKEPSVADKQARPENATDQVQHVPGHGHGPGDPQEPSGSAADVSQLRRGGADLRRSA